MNTRRRLIDLAAFLAVLGTGTTLIALGVSPQNLAVVAIAITGLYGIWLNIDSRGDRAGTTAEHEHPGESGQSDETMR